jgi:hypothetical protein
VYIIGGIIMLVAFVLVVAMKELPLRTRSALDERLQEQADSEAALANGEVDAGTIGATRVTDEDRPADTVAGRTGADDRLEPVASGAHAMVGSGGAHAATDGVVLNGEPARRVATGRGRHRA